MSTQQQHRALSWGLACRGVQVGHYTVQDRDGKFHDHACCTLRRLSAQTPFLPDDLAAVWAVIEKVEQETFGAEIVHGIGIKSDCELLVFCRTRKHLMERLALDEKAYERCIERFGSLLTSRFSEQFYAEASTSAA